MIMFSLRGVQHRIQMKTCASSLLEETELLQGRFGLPHEQFGC